jgi:hypothetical protein
MGQVVDTETAKEFMKETLEKVDVEELSKICAEVEAKSASFREALSQEALPELTPSDLHSVLLRVFSTRGKTRATLEAFDLDDMRGWFAELLYGAGELAGRLEAFVGRLDGVAENVRVDLASEVLHFTDPEQYWLWTRWMWDPRTRTGALPLVTTAAYDLQGDRPGEIYMKVGRAVAFVHEVGDAAGFQRISRSIFGTDVFLCCVYAIYTYTVLRMRMTQEFNKVMPNLPEFCRRLLGVHEKRSTKAAICK